MESFLSLLVPQETKRARRKVDLASKMLSYVHPTTTRGLIHAMEPTTVVRVLVSSYCVGNQGVSTDTIAQKAFSRTGCILDCSGLLFPLRRRTK
jgi:hypothetical protein